MKISAKQEANRIRTIDQLLQRYDLDAITSIKRATENNVSGLNKINATLEEFIEATVGSLENMQSQIDGSISTWFYTGEPTLENTPANEWTSSLEKDAHLGDLYYDKDTGYGYRFSKTEDSYEWVKLTDNDIVEALAIANAAQDTADGKRRVFVADPKPPYDEGDLWFKDEEIYICVVTKATGEYVEGDFVIATKYTDDTKALEVEAGLNKVILRVDHLETTSLTAESATIKDLEADITRTNTLIFGSASGTSIQTEFSNSVIAMLGDAQIKSAMIESVSAAKITAGDIITNNVRVMSEDGSLVISDETMQISDANRVRVQIGKDALDDYNMYVWDSSGNLMFDALGLTEYGITRQIIRDDMVSENANINAAKLDIESLFTEINGSSNTIKSTKVYFDSEKQTLDAVFESMTTTIDGLQTTQNSQGTQISAIQGQISSKIWQQDINTAVNEVEGDVSALSTQYSTLNQTVTGLSSTVGSHTTQISSLGTRVTATESSYTQLSDKFSWMVKSGTSATDFTLTDRMAELTTEIVSLNADVKVSGDMIVDGSITAKKIDVEDLFTQDITASGTIKGLNLEGGNISLSAETNLEARLTITNSNTGQYVMMCPGTMRFYNSAGDIQADIFGAVGAFNIYRDGEVVTSLTSAGAKIGGSCSAQALSLTGYESDSAITLSVVGTSEIVGTLTATSVKTTAGVDLDQLYIDLLNVHSSHRRQPGTYTDQVVEGVNGYITSSGTEAILFIPMCWQINVSRCSVSKIVASIRHVGGGYLGGAINTNLSAYISNVYIKQAQGVLVVQLIKSNGWGITNNTPLCGYATISYVVS